MVGRFLLNKKLNSNIFHYLKEWFASAENLLKDSDVIWKENIYTDFGKWMDGWVSYTFLIM